MYFHTAMGGKEYNNAPDNIFPFPRMAGPDLVPMVRKRTGGWKHKRRGRFACKPANSRPTPLSVVRTPTSESVGWLLLLFAIEKQVKKFSSAFRKAQKVFFLYFWDQKYQNSARRSPREDTPRGAARGAQDQAYAPPRDRRAACPTLFFRVKRECGIIVPPLAARNIYIIPPGDVFSLSSRRKVDLFSRKAIPDLVPMAKKRTEG